MIYLDFTIFVSLIIGVFIAVVLTVWYFERPQRGKKLFLDPRYIWFCTVCTYTYINTKDEVISNCPRCGGYNKKA